MNFDLSPYQYHALDPKKRMSAALRGLAGFSDGIEAQHRSGAHQGIVPTGRASALLSNTFASPVIGSGLTNSRVQMVPSGDSIDFRDHSLTRLPTYSNHPNTNTSKTRPNFIQRALQGLGAAAGGSVAPNAASIAYDLQAKYRLNQALPTTLAGAQAALRNAQAMLPPVNADIAANTAQCSAELPQVTAKYGAAVMQQQQARDAAAESQRYACNRVKELTARVGAINTMIDALNELISALSGRMSTQPAIAAWVRADAKMAQSVSAAKSYANKSAVTVGTASSAQQAAVAAAAAQRAEAAALALVNKKEAAANKGGGQKAPTTFNPASNGSGAASAGPSPEATPNTGTRTDPIDPSTGQPYIADQYGPPGFTPNGQNDNPGTPGLDTVPFQYVAPQQGMSTTAKVGIGLALLGGVYLWSKRKG